MTERKRNKNDKQLNNEVRECAKKRRQFSGLRPTCSIRVKKTSQRMP